MWNPHHIDPASDERVRGGKLLKPQRAGMGRRPLRARITKRLIKEGREGWMEEREGERRMKRDGTTERKWGSGYYLQHELQIVCRRREEPPPDMRILSPFFFFFLSFEHPNALSLPLPSPFLPC